MSIHLTLRHTTIALHDAVTLALLILSGAECACAKEVAVTSPNGFVKFRLVQRDAVSLGFEVRFRDRPVLETSPLGFSVDGVELTVGATVGKVETYELVEKYPWHGGHAEATNRCRGARIGIEHTASKTGYTLDMRAYDDGVAFRYIVPGGDKARMPDEATTFVVCRPAARSGITTSRDITKRVYKQKATSRDVPAGQWVAPPLTFKLPDDAGYASITEAALVELQRHGPAGGRPPRVQARPRPRAPAVVPVPAALRRRRRAAVTSPAAVAGHDHVAVAGRDGRGGPECAGQLRRRSQPLPAAGPEAVPEGRTHRLGQARPGGVEIPRRRREHARRDERVQPPGRRAGLRVPRGRGLLVAVDRRADQGAGRLLAASRASACGSGGTRKNLRTPEAREEFFKKLHDLGVVGAKIDFFDHEHKEVVDLYHGPAARGGRGTRSWSTSTAPTNRPARRAPGPTS